ncbi:hypothetical protein BKA80DRAFT_269023 [Phyllosticta citrichinensis]
MGQRDAMVVVSTIFPVAQLLLASHLRPRNLLTARSLNASIPSTWSHIHARLSSSISVESSVQVSTLLVPPPMLL